jgi:L-idonate 5-dehydrogenase
MRGGKVMTIGRGAKENQKVPLLAASSKEVDIIGSFRYRGAYKKALELVECGKVSVLDMITHEFDLKDI